MEKNLGSYTVVVSAVNFTEGGPLTILRDCLISAANHFKSNVRIIALVNNHQVIDDPRIEIIPIPSAKKSWFHRLYWEWIGFNKLSKEINPSLWLSLHDITPRVFAKRLVVYCHNPSPFYKINFLESWFDPTFFIFNKFYLFFYLFLIQKNFYVVVQQEWLRSEFKKLNPDLNIVVAHPFIENVVNRGALTKNKNFIFLYPALPRVFKNFEVLCEAVEILSARGIDEFEVRLTISGDENRYARWIKRRHSKNELIKFIGRQSSDRMKDQYAEASAVVFPSRLETWGLPISEAKMHQLPLVVADLSYAHETVGDYQFASFFSVDSPEDLAKQMELLINGLWTPIRISYEKPCHPFASSWSSLWKILEN